MNKKIIFLLTDALRGDYPELHDMKFLKQKLSEDNRIASRAVHPSTGFCEIIEYVLGQSASEHGMLAQITAKENWHEMKYRPYLSVLYKYNNIFGNIPKVRGVWRIFLDKLMSSITEPEVARVRYHIPIHMLDYFRATESLYEYDSWEFGGENNLFYWFKENNISYDIDNFVKFNKIKGIDKDRFEDINNKIKNKSLKDFTLAYIGNAEMAHFKGTTSNEFKEYMVDMDKSLEVLSKNLDEHYDNYELVILGDHGMVDVEQHVDCISEIKKIANDLGISEGKDYIYFVDSTCLRLWFKQPELHQSLFDKKLVDIIGEHLELTDDITNYLDKFKPEYGNLLYLIQGKKIFYPDFFNTKANVGMHGYKHDIFGQQGLLLLTGPNVENNDVDKIELKDIKSLIISRYQNGK
ncbi:alkaline phosphatase family protein [Photobacterium aquimaris]|uniref:Type I phosphodiesterase / nucleotide pyrophosphatase n=1 Tax=Photobacterium aquimaris TaxID=512643 RepID=A0A1Y6L103_9GAMM|nr:alkaline phosphatase family protein [Photobacterium aquimaris]SMY17007.1 Type I phosphodiesterase / nucleotide pyrophosphatase [Photobacterium aquimaris]